MEIIDGRTGSPVLIQDVVGSRAAIDLYAQNFRGYLDFYRPYSSDGMEVAMVTRQVDGLVVGTAIRESSEDAWVIAFFDPDRIRP